MENCSIVENQAGSFGQTWQELRKVWRLGLARRPWLLIYQMGKVGSQTLEATLRESALPHRIYRLHILSPESQSRMSHRLCEECLPEPTRTSLRNQLAEARAIYKAISLRKKWGPCNKWRRKLEVIAGVREPVGLLLASIFENAAAYFDTGEKITLARCRDVMTRAPNLPETIRQLALAAQTFIHQWFDQELKEVLGIDVYSKPFAHDDGYVIYENAVARVLVYRYEDFRRIQEILESFLGLNIAALVNRNIGAEKDYGKTYQAVKRELRLPADFLSEQYNTKLSRHFYTQKELEGLQAEWQM